MSKLLREKERRKITPSIMATWLAPLVHAFRSNQFSLDIYGLMKTGAVEHFNRPLLIILGKLSQPKSTSTQRADTTMGWD
jgi:hypothetical protein